MDDLDKYFKYAIGDTFRDGIIIDRVINQTTLKGLPVTRIFYKIDYGRDIQWRPENDIHLW